MLKLNRLNFVPSLNEKTPLSHKQQQDKPYEISMLTTFLQEAFAFLCALKSSQQYFQPRIGQKNIQPWRKNHILK